MAIVNMKSNLSQINKDYKIIVNKESNIDKQYDIMSDHEIRENSKKGLPSLFSQPYIIRKPNDPLRKSKMLDSRIFPIGSAADDIFRIGKWTISPTGMLWQLKQFGLQRLNPRAKTRKYNLLGPLGSIIPYVRISRVFEAHIFGPKIYETWVKKTDKEATNIIYAYPYTDQINKFINLSTSLSGITIPKKNKSLKQRKPDTSDWIASSKKDKNKFSTIPYNELGIWDYRYPRKSPSQVALLTNKVDNKNNSVNAPGKNELITKYKFGDSGKKSDRSDRSNEHSDAQDKLNLIPYGKYGTEENDIKNVDPAEGSGNWPDLIPFKIYDMYQDTWIIFRATLKGLADTISPTWNSTNYIGRPTAIHTYGGVSRTFSLDFKVAAMTQQEMKPLWQKINYLIGLGYPAYKNQTMIGPFIKLTIGDLLKDTPGFFNSISVTYDDDWPWEIGKIGNDQIRLPMGCSINCNFTVVGDRVLASNSKHIFGLPISWDDVGPNKKNDWTRAYTSTPTDKVSST